MMSRSVLWKKVVVACWRALSRHCPEESKKNPLILNTLRTGDADLRF